MVIIVGHTRLAAAKALGLATVPVHIAEGLTPARARAYRLMDNRSSENAEWDDELLTLEFGDLQQDGYDLDLTGFDDAELARLLADEAEDGADPDAAPAVPEVQVSRPGDLWSPKLPPDQWARLNRVYPLIYRLVCVDEDARGWPDDDIGNLRVGLNALAGVFRLKAA